MSLPACPPRSGDTARDSCGGDCDIPGDEDHVGDMDFKVCGTRKGITSIQMGIKTSGRTTKIMRRALDQARVGRLHILDELLKPLAEIPHGSASSRRESPPS